MWYNYILQKYIYLHTFRERVCVCVCMCVCMHAHALVCVDITVRKCWCLEAFTEGGEWCSWLTWLPVQGQQCRQPEGQMQRCQCVTECSACGCRLSPENNAEAKTQPESFQTRDQRDENKRSTFSYPHTAIDSCLWWLRDSLHHTQKNSADGTTCYWFISTFRNMCMHMCRCAFSFPQ